MGVYRKCWFAPSTQLEPIFIARLPELRSKHGEGSMAFYQPCVMTLHARWWAVMGCVWMEVRRMLLDLRQSKIPHAPLTNESKDDACTTNEMRRLSRPIIVLNSDGIWRRGFGLGWGLDFSLLVSPMMADLLGTLLAASDAFLPRPSAPICANNNLLPNPSP